MRRLGRALFLFALSCSAVAPVRPDGTEVAEAIEAGDRARRTGGGNAALRHYREALDREPSQRRAHVGIQELLLDRGLDLDARVTYRTLGDPFLTARLEGADARARSAYEEAPEPLQSLGRGRMAWRDGDWKGALREFERVTRLDPGLDWGWSSLGRALLIDGRVGESYEAFRNAIWLAPHDPHGWYGVARAAQRLGRRDAALIAARETFQRIPRDPNAADRLAAASRQRGEADRRAAAALLTEGGSVRALLHAAELHAGLQEGEQCERCLQRALEAGASQGELESIAPDDGGPREFIRRFSAGVTARYRHYRATGEAESMASFRDWARKLYTETTGEELATAGPIEKYAFVGELIDPTAESREPLVQALARHGLLLILGQRSGGPPEAMLARIIRRSPTQEVASRGTRVEREAVWIGKRHLSGYVEWLGGGDLAGLALGNIVLVDVHAAAGWEGALRRRRDRLLRDAALTQLALRDTPVDSVEDPAGVAERLLLEAEIDIAAEVLVHEDAHLVDADRYLPGRGSLARGIGLALKSGLSASGVLATLERNAQLTAIAEGPHPRGALAVTCSALGGRGVHARGYTQIVRGMVRLILERADRYPGIERDRVIVQQLHRLTDEEIRSLAVKLQEEWGVR
ncbi:MAG: tetratricopeptide repeat protein [Planctomycetota bacterium]